MFPIAGQTAGPIGLKFCGHSRSGWGVSKAKKIRFFFVFKFLKTIFFSRATPGPLASSTYTVATKNRGNEYLTQKFPALKVFLRVLFL